VGRPWSFAIGWHAAVVCRRRLLVALCVGAVGDVEARTRVDLTDLLRIVRERWLIVSVGLVAGLLAAWVVTVGTAPTYESPTTLLINGQGTASDSGDAGAQNSLSQDLVATYAELVRTRPVAEAVVARLHLPISPAELRGTIAWPEYHEPGCPTADHPEPPTSPQPPPPPPSHPANHRDG
jgi:Chain length determinant protein